LQQLLQQPLGLAAVALCLVPIHRIAWRRGRGIWKQLVDRLRVNGMGNFEKITGSEKMDMDGQGYNDI
jgi:hypothetical protein